MPREYIPEEVEVLRFFEESPIEKAEMLFNIVKEKMRGRLAGNAHSGDPSPRKKRHATPKDGEGSPEDKPAELSPHD
ncbi:MAG: hypothetical protein LAP13_22055 [Acidobacteriia bacterium]|nr:hypothetical protein [Terriglobia bacterium]